MTPVDPSRATGLIGHADAEDLLLRQALGATLPNAYLIVGAPGIGKATLGWRLAKFLLSGRADPAAEEPGLFGDALPATPPSTLAVTEGDPAVARMLAGSHADFLLIEREWDEKKHERKANIQVKAVRQLGGFLSHTAVEGRWKVVLIDDAEAMTEEGANAMLKWLEEPPRNALFILISSRPGDLLPTIRSRCRVLSLALPDEDGFGEILHRSGLSLDATERELLHRLSGGSPGIALQLRAEHAPNAYADLLRALVDHEPEALTRFAEKATYGKEAVRWETITRLIARFLSQLAKAASGAPVAAASLEERQAVEEVAARKPLDYWLGLWEKSSALLADAEALHLNRKHALLGILQALAGHAEVAAAIG